MGSVMDLWHFKRGDERVSITARGWLVVRQRAPRHGGATWRWPAAGWRACSTGTSARAGRSPAALLVPALTDWELDEVPPVNLLYPPSVRRIPRVRVFIDFVTQLFRDIEQQREVARTVHSDAALVQGQRPRASATR